MGSNNEIYLFSFCWSSNNESLWLDCVFWSVEETWNKVLNSTLTPKANVKILYHAAM